MNKSRLLTDLANVKQGCIERNESYIDVENAIAMVTAEVNDTGIIQALVDNKLSYFASSIVEGNYKEMEEDGTSDQASE